MFTKLVKPIVLFFVLLTVTGHVWATLIPSTTSLAYACLGRTSSCELGSNQSASTVNVSYGSAADQAVMTGTAQAVSNYGTLGAGATSTINISGSPALAETVGDAAFQDVITVNFAPFAGRTGQMIMYYSLSGTTSASGQDNAFASVRIGVGSTLEQQYTALYTSSFAGTTLVPKTFTFIYGQPFGLYFDLIVGTGTITPVPGGGGYFLSSGTGSGTSQSDFFDTLALTDLTIIDPSGDLVNGATITSASGTRYTTNAAAVPEPRLTVILGLALSGVASVSRRIFRVQLARS